MQCFAHRDADVFHRVVFVDVDITFGLNREIEKSMLGQQLQHMIEKPDGGVDLSAPAPSNTHSTRMSVSFVAR